MSSTIESTRTITDFVNYDLNPTLLYKALEECQWKAATLRCQRNPQEARIWVYKRNAGSSKTIRWCVLPIHQACARDCPEHVVGSLIEAYPNGVRKKSYQISSAGPSPDSVYELDHSEGNLPIHYACFWGAHENIIHILLSAFPESLNIPDSRGLNPFEIVQKSNLKNKEQIILTIEKFQNDLKMKGIEKQINDIGRKLGNTVQPPDDGLFRSQNGNSLKIVDNENIEAKVKRLESENSSLRRRVKQQNEAIASLLGKLDFLISSQNSLVKMSSEQEEKMKDLMSNLNN